jgi:hypothetical protein
MDGLSRLTGLSIALAVAGCVSATDTTSLQADLDGDGITDKIVMVQSPDLIILQIQPGAASKLPQRLEFGVDPARQDALCKLPAVLKAVSLVCDPMDEQLEGCRAGNGAQGLLLADGECDPIQLYWNHDAGELWWWRL